MQSEELLSAVLDLGKAMIVNGAEVWKVEEILNGICDAYSLNEHDILVLGKSLQATVQTGDGQLITQIKRIGSTGYDDDKLEKLFKVAHRVLESPVDSKVLKEQIREITESPGNPFWMTLLGCIISTCSFMLFFNGDIRDIIVTAVLAAAVQKILRHVMKDLNNAMAANAVAAFDVGLFVLLLAQLGAVRRPGSVITAEIMLLLSGLGITNGFRNLLHNDVLSGMTDTINAFLGTMGIVIGITLAMFVVFDYTRLDVHMQGLTASPVLQILFCTIACSSCAVIFGAKKKVILYSAAGTAATWCVFLLVSKVIGGGSVLAVLAGAAAAALYSRAIEKLTYIPETVFLTICILPLVPGLQLYYGVLGALISDKALFLSQFRDLILTCFSICIGFILVDILCINLKKRGCRTK